MRFRSACITGMVALSFTPLANCMEAGEWVWRAGAHTIQPKSDNHGVVNVDGSEMLTFSVSYMFDQHWGVQVLGALPFEHDINLSGGGKVADAKHLPPVLTLQYHFNPQGTVQPYVGVGLNYTHFFSEDTTGALAGSKLELDSSVGPTAQLGFDIALASDWVLNLDARWIDIDADAKLDGADIGTVEIDPYVFGVSLGKRFR